MHGHFSTFGFIVLLTLITGCSSPEESETRPTGRNVLKKATLNQALHDQVDFVTHVKPVLEAKCAICHHQAALPGRMSLASRQEAQRSGTLRAFIVPGHPESSPLLTRLTSAHTNLQAMPPVGETLTPEEVTLLERWISQGATWPASPTGDLRLEPMQ